MKIVRYTLLALAAFIAASAQGRLENPADGGYASGIALISGNAFGICLHTRLPFTGQFPVNSRSVRRLPEKNVPDCEGFLVVFKEREQEHSAAMQLLARHRRRARWYVL
jgi:hypothetical protein